MSDDEIPRLVRVVRPGWTDTIDLDLKTPHGKALRILFYPDGERRFEHICDRGERGIVVCAPLLSPTGHHVSGTTISPSILCDDCGVHGFVVDGTWVEV